jgi:copper(I)-binding protein
LAAEAASVDDPWVRATVPGQSVAAAYLEITAKSAAALVGADSPLARKAELHTMMLDGGVMKMRPVAAVELPANQRVSLKPGGYHIMLLDIRRELKAGERVPLRLVVRDAKGVKSTLKVEAEVRAVAGSGQLQHKQ